ncbi:MAG: hypothetical protein KDD16_02450 [Mangrovimonas sp.]|nr:hypothetical protein [Mangrovimonas sp.]
MIKTIKITALLLLISIKGFSQLDTLTLEDGQTLEGSVIIIDKAKVYFESADDGKRKWYKKVKSVNDYYEDTLIEFKFRDIKGFSKYLTGLVCEGKVSYYKYYKYIPGSGKTQLGTDNVGSTYAFFFMVNESTGKILEDMPNSLVTPYKKRMAKFFSDCDELVNKINNDEYKEENTIDAVTFFNENCN